MKPSIYNLYSKTSDGLFIYNTLSGAAVELDEVNSKLFKQKDFELIEYNELLCEYGILISDDSELSKIKNYRNLLNKHSDVLNVTILPTTKCNLKCTYCFEAKRAITMNANTYNQMTSFLESYIKENGYKKLNVTWFGGEPLLNIGLLESIYKEIDLLAIRLNITLENSIITNGTLLNDYSVSVITKMKNLKFVQITLDGDKPAHDQRRILLNGSSYDLIISNIAKYIDVLPIIIRVNIDKINIDIIDKLLMELSNIPKIKEKVIVDFAKVVGESTSCYTDRDFAVKRSKLIKKLREYGFSNCSKIFLPQPSLIQCLSVTKHSLVIDANGDLYSCLEVVGNQDYKMGNVSVGLSSPNKKLNDNVSEDCLECSVFPVCHFGCPLHNEIKDINNCRYIPELLLEDVKEYFYNDSKS